MAIKRFCDICGKNITDAPLMPGIEETTLIQRSKSGEPMYREVFVSVAVHPKDGETLDLCLLCVFGIVHRFDPHATAQDVPS